MRAERPFNPEPELPWQAAGWERPPKNGREHKLARDGKPQPEAPIPPCRKCGGRRFGLKRRKDCSRGIGRYCMDCSAKSSLAWKERNRERVREADRKRAAQRRAQERRKAR